MTRSFEEAGTIGRNARLQSISRLAIMLAAGLGIAPARQQEQPAQLVRLFVYGFGLLRLSVDEPRDGREVRDLLAPKFVGERTVDLEALRNDKLYTALSMNLMWSLALLCLDDWVGRPVLTAFRKAASRLTRELGNGRGRGLVCIVCSGPPTDGGKDFQDLKAFTDEMRAQGTTVVSCYSGRSPPGEPKRLWGAPEETWTPTARLLFDIASGLENAEEFRGPFFEAGWIIDTDARLFFRLSELEAFAALWREALRP